MQPVLLDTSVCIQALRGGSGVFSRLRHTLSRPVWMSAVVFGELYAGADDEEREAIEQLQRDFERIRRVLVPNLKDWTLAGRLLAKIAAKHDYEETGIRRLTNDALIAASAARNGIAVLTANRRDFELLSKFHQFSWTSLELSEPDALS